MLTLKLFVYTIVFSFLFLSLDFYRTIQDVIPDVKNSEKSL
uniref:Photosystem II protein I n=2 Tax=Larix potaninii TaxID=154026 RepID=A0A1X9QGX1_9CONI|nr:photosystem II protein I [Larix potaninii var. australis]ARQ27082.1 photosystem II protein I [Larix potaninii var. chinensis]ASS30819.1 photosystem II protein I [Larix potaninii var. australis]UMY72722.1 photosystem II protein I [Larix potaninii var. australis]